MNRTVRLIGQDNAKIEKVLNSDTPKKTADKLFPSSNEEELDSEDDGSAPEVDGVNRQGGSASKKDKAEALFVRAQQGYEKLPDAQKKRFRDLIRKFLAEEVMDEPEPGVQDQSPSPPLPSVNEIYEVDGYAADADGKTYLDPDGNQVTVESLFRKIEAQDWNA